RAFTPPPRKWRVLMDWKGLLESIERVVLNARVGLFIAFTILVGVGTLKFFGGSSWVAEIPEDKKVLFDCIFYGAASAVVLALPFAGIHCCKQLTVKRRDAKKRKERKIFLRQRQEVLHNLNNLEKYHLFYSVMEPRGTYQF